MHRSTAILALFFLLLGCTPAAPSTQVPAADLPEAAASPQVEADATAQVPVVDPVDQPDTGCADLREVMGYLDHMGFSDFEEGEPENGLSVRGFSDQDALFYGQAMTIKYTGTCVLDISGVFVSHYPATDEERKQFSLFMTAISLAGLTVDQRQALVDWVAERSTSSILKEAENKGSATRSTRLGFPASFPAVELKDEITEDAIYTHYRAQFGKMPGEQ